LGCPVWNDIPPTGKVEVVEVSPGDPEKYIIHPISDDTPTYPDKEYPARSIRLHECGEVFLSLEVREDGSVSSARVIESPFERLAAWASHYAMKAWKFPKQNSENGNQLTIKVFRVKFRLFNKSDGTEISCNP
jgi:TonB family protein